MLAFTERTANEIIGSISLEEMEMLQCHFFILVDPGDFSPMKFTIHSLFSKSQTRHNTFPIALFYSTSCENIH